MVVYVILDVICMLSLTTATIGKENQSNGDIPPFKVNTMGDSDKLWETITCKLYVEVITSGNKYVTVFLTKESQSEPSPCCHVDTW